jgi:RNA polymerase sigma factor (sigma-70 family)
VKQDRVEYEWLYRASYPNLLRTVYLIVRDRGRAEEVCQDAYLQLLQHWSTVAHYERPEAWVRRVAIQLAVRQAKRERTRKVLERAGPTERADTLPDVDLANAIATLAPMQRAVVVLYYLEDRPVLEVARLLQVSESTVKQHLFRARARLAELLGEEVTEDVR